MKKKELKVEVERLERVLELNKKGLISVHEENKELKEVIERLNAMPEINEAIIEMQNKMLNAELDLSDLRNKEIRLLEAKNALLSDKQKTETFDGLRKSENLVETKDFKIGDVVELNSGGVKMTIADVTEGCSIVYCSWFNDNELMKGEFHEDCLVYPPLPPFNVTCSSTEIILSQEI